MTLLAKLIAEKQPQRRGVLLLIVLSMLTLFMMLGTTYLVVASRAKATAKAFARASHYSESAHAEEGKRFVDEAFKILARGTTNSDCIPPALRQGDDLLGDKYGQIVFVDPPATTRPFPVPPALTGQFTSAAQMTGAAGLIVLTLTTPIPNVDPTAAVPKARLTADLNGCVVTISLPGLVASTRILRAWAASTNGPTLSLAIPAGVAFNGAMLDVNDLNNRIQKATGSAANHFLINTREFDGDKINSADMTKSNEPYDGFDSSNPFLAQIQPGPQPSAGNPRTPVTVTKPSFASEVPPLSIDNDTDGVLDSKWLDVGFPMLTDESGTQYKAKAAYYVLDLDGRLNVNAHGGAEPLDDTDSLWTGTAHPSVPTSFATLPAGSNYGVSEIHLRELFPVPPVPPMGTASSPDPVNSLLYGETDPNYKQPLTPYSPKPNSLKRPLLQTQLVDGRFGSDGFPGKQSQNENISKIQDSQQPLTRAANTPQRTTSLPNDWGTSTQTTSVSKGAFGSPSDLRGFMKIYAPSRAAGTIVPEMRYVKPSGFWNNDTTDDPYEVRLDRGSPRLATNARSNPATLNQDDNNFCVAELERFLRPFDSDSAQLPTRLSKLFDIESENSRFLFTTDSWDSIAITGNAWCEILKRIQTIDPTKLHEVLSPEVMAGRRLDINRPCETDSEKQLLFRHLYTLIWALTGQATADAAQWAANVVDFRDIDSTMTRFQYDTNLTDGWTINPASSPDVFGVERPELVMTEALAWSKDGGNGGFYVVLHRPWAAKAYDGGNPKSGTTNASKYDPEALSVDLTYPLYDPQSTNTLDPVFNSNKLNLDLRGADDDDSPVWRLNVDGTKIRLDESPKMPPPAGEYFSSHTSVLPNDARYMLPNSWLCIASTDTAGEVTVNIPNKLDIDKPSPYKPPAKSTITVIKLERLADPTLKYDATTNPYREVDQITQINVRDRTLDMNMPPQPKQRHQKRIRLAATPDTAFWKQEFNSVDIPIPITSPGTCDELSGSAKWMPWNSRPYLSNMELVFVPVDSCDTLLTNYSSATAFGGLTALGTMTGAPLLPTYLLASTIVPTRFSAISTTVDAPAVSFGSPGVTGLENLPINQLSDYREPGRVNLNTVVDNKIWDAVVARKVATPPANTTPLSDRNTAGFSNTPAKNFSELVRLGGTGIQPKIDGASPGPDPSLNPAFAYLTANRLANAATNRSNVFAIWVTVGFFENGSTTEMGSDTGEVRRYRGFYIFDRSIPVGYQTGVDHNIEDAILLRRIIQ